MIAPETLRYAVVLSKTGDFLPPKIAEALAKTKKIPFADAAPEARRCWGLAGDDLPKDQADLLAGKLKEAGLESVVLPKNLVEELPPADRLAKAELGDEKLRATLASGQERWLSWSSVTLLSAIAYKEIKTSTIKVKEGPDLAQKAMNMGLKLATGLPINLGPGERMVERTKETSDLAFYLDLCLTEPALRLRVDAQDFDYSCLKAKMAYNAHSNFRILLGELAAKVPGALKNRGSLILLEGKPLANAGYDSLADMERESRWLLTLKTLKKV